MDQREQQVLELRDKFLAMSKTPWEELEPLFLKEFLQIIEHAKLSPWWNSRLADIEIDKSSLSAAIESLPFLSRNDVQDNSIAMQALVPGSRREDYVLQKTSGSTSKPIQVVKYEPLYFQELDAWALFEWTWHNRDPKKKFGAFRLGVKDAEDIAVGPPLSYVGLKNFSFQLSSVDHSADELLDAIVRYEPHYLLSNPVSLRLAAHEQIRNPQKVMQIEQVLTLADRVDSSLRELVRDTFGAKIVDRYSSVEFGFIAIQCPVHEHLHVVSPSVYVEILNENNEPCKVGEPGRVVITGLHTFAQPFLRYEQGDIAQWGEPCDAGISWPVIEEVHGRVRTISSSPEGKPRLVTLFGADFMLIRTIIDYMVVKFSDSVVFIAQVREPLTLTEQDRIRTSMREVFREEVTVHMKITGEPLGERTYKAAELFIINKPFDEKLNIAGIKELISHTTQIFY